MSSFPLVDVVWLSQKRTRILLHLLNGPKNSEEIRDELELDIRALHLPLKELKEEGIVNQDDGRFFLSEIGRIVSMNAKPSYDLANIFERNTSYWISRDLTNIPQNFARRLGELEDCQLFEQYIGQMFQLPERFIKSTSKTSNVMSLLSFFYPEHLHLYTEVAKKGGEVSLIMTEGVFETLMENFPETLSEMSRFNNTKLYCLSGELSPPSFTINDEILLISFFNKNRRYDHQDMMCNSNRALKWGKELFEHYKKKASLKTPDI